MPGKKAAKNNARKSARRAGKGARKNPAARGTTGDVFLRRRRAALRVLGKDHDLQALLISCPQDVSYLTGFAGEDSWLLLVHPDPLLITDARYDEQARHECPGLELLVRTGPMSGAVAGAAADRGLQSLGIQGDHLMVSAERRLAEKLARRCKVRPVSGVVDGLREIKDDGEIRAIARAAEVAERAFRDLFNRGPDAFVGRTEREVAAELDYLMVRGGATKPSFDTIVAAGPHASHPHYRPGETVIAAGQGILIDWGALVGGYCSDLTRVICAGRIPPKLARMHEMVYRAQQAAMAKVRPGVQAGSVDAAAREVVEASEYAGKFTHGLGHGIGRVVHEAPTVAKGRTQRLRKGMVFTIEPGVYLPGEGGVRIEDDVVVTSAGCRRLTSLPAELESLTLGRTLGD
jgi:Xaa-Pro aminopeptidase